MLIQIKKPIEINRSIYEMLFARKQLRIVLFIFVVIQSYRIVLVVSTMDFWLVWIARYLVVSTIRRIRYVQASISQYDSDLVSMLVYDMFLLRITSDTLLLLKILLSRHQNLLMCLMYPLISSSNWFGIDCSKLLAKTVEFVVVHRLMLMELRIVAYFLSCDVLEQLCERFQDFFCWWTILNLLKHFFLFLLMSFSQFLNSPLFTIMSFLQPFTPSLVQMVCHVSHSIKINSFPCSRIIYSHVFQKDTAQIFPKVQRTGVACIFNVWSLLLNWRNCMKPVVDGCEIHQWFFIRSQEEKLGSICMIVLLKVTDQLQNHNTFFSPRVSNILRLPRMNDRKQISARQYLTHMHITSIKIFIRLIGYLQRSPSFCILLLLDLIPIEFLLALETVNLVEVWLVDPSYLAIAQKFILH